MSELEKVLHKIVNRLPIFPSEKDELLADVTRVLGDQEVPDAEE